jgi:methylglyoxal synthase
MFRRLGRSCSLGCELGPKDRKMACVALIVSPNLRDEALFGLLRKYRTRLQQERIVATQGTYDYLATRDIIGSHSRSGDASPHIRLRPGNIGGIIEIGNFVIKDLCRTVIFLTDPSDEFADSPENRALIRVCIHKKVTVIQTLDGLRYWLMQSQVTDDMPPGLSPRRGAWLAENGSAPPDHVSNVTTRGTHRALTIGKQTVALVAHDQVKFDMYLFAVKQRRFLSGFGRIIGTGTTARQVHRLTGLNIEAFESGPKGGDVEIAKEILEHRCHWLIFLIDPLSAHPHIEDVRLLQRTCQLPGVFCRAFFSLETATYAAVARPK